MSVSKTVAVLHQTLGFGSKLLFPAPAKIYFCDRSVRMNARKATQHLSILSSFVLRNAGLMLRVHAIIHVVKYHWAAKHGHVWECGNLGYFQQPFARPLEPQTMKRQMSLGWFFLQLKTATRGETGLVETKWHKMNRRSMRLKRIGFNWAGMRRHCQSRTSPWIERHTCDRGQLWPNIHLRGPWNSTCCKAAPRGPWNLRRWNCCFSLFFPQPCVHLWGFYGSS